MTDQNCVSSTGPIGCYRVRCALGKVCAAAMEVALPAQPACGHCGRMPGSTEHCDWIECAAISPAQPTAQAVRQHELTVWYGAMPESNGKSNFTAILMRNGGDFTDGITIDRSEYPERVRYEADRVRYLIGELSERPFILDYDADKHSGYLAQAAPVASSVSADPLQALVDQAQALDMGYGKNACPTCGKLASAALVVQEPLSDSAIIDLCEMSNIHWLNPDDEEDGFPGSFDMASMAQMRNLLSGTVAAQVVPEGWQEVIEALKYYADGHHFTLHTPEAWDTVSGEPVNFQEDEACTATVEDGSVAKMALDKIAAAPKEPTT